LYNLFLKVQVLKNLNLFDMKKLFLIAFLLITSFVFVRCEKFQFEDPNDVTDQVDENYPSEKAEFIKDCTGSYIRIENKDYKVCYYKEVVNYKTGDVISVVYKKKKECTTISPDELTCKMAHSFEYYIEIIKTDLLYRPNDVLTITSQKMKVVKDCSGTYLRYKNEDYQVANREVLAKYNDGDWIVASFYSLSEYHGNPDEVVCALYHENKGWVKAYDIQ
jgi:hypothetical protein